MYVYIDINIPTYIVDTWWQTETGGHMITPLPGATPQKPGWATRPFFGVEPVILGPDGEELDGEAEGYLAMKRSWPGQLRGVYGDQQRYEETYFQLFSAAGKKISNDKYIAGDACRRSADGYYCITGRIYLSIYIYIYIERERDVYLSIYMYRCICTYI